MRKKPSSEKLKILNELFVEASKEKDKRLREKLVKKARDFAKHENLLIPSELKDKFCRKCNIIFNSKNQKIRLSKGKISKECLNCHHISRRKFK
jgi:RNase P subunit RPR2